jgi:hypothetical protein
VTDPEPRGDGAPSEEALWQSIVDNYGDRPELPDDDAGPEEPPPPTPSAEAREARSDMEWGERFVPPEPPPLPPMNPPVVAAWLGVLVAPLALMAVVMFSLPLPSLFGALLVLWFLGGFAFLVSAMPNEPRDPWDDGAQV